MNIIIKAIIFFGLIFIVSFLVFSTLVKFFGKIFKIDSK